MTTALAVLKKLPRVVLRRSRRGPDGILAPRSIMMRAA